MTDFILKADATFGLKVKVNDVVEKGVQLGTDSDTQKPLISPVKGLVKNISFNPQQHTFEITISPKL